MGYTDDYTAVGMSLDLNKTLPDDGQLISPEAIAQAFRIMLTSYVSLQPPGATYRFADRDKLARLLHKAHMITDDEYRATLTPQSGSLTDIVPATPWRTFYTANNQEPAYYTADNEEPAFLRRWVSCGNLIGRVSLLQVLDVETESETLQPPRITLEGYYAYYDHRLDRFGALYIDRYDESLMDITSDREGKELLASIVDCMRSWRRTPVDQTYYAREHPYAPASDYM
jgi:hypothetical protein